MSKVDTFFELLRLQAAITRKRLYIAKTHNNWPITEYLVSIFSERMLSPVRLSVVCLSVVCRLSSVTLVHPTQAVQIFGNISTAFGTLAIR